MIKDTDGDGVRDKDDACPTVPGLKKFNGCPDTDGDGIQDSKDFCPEIAGSESLKGCPDSDGDGFSDKEDLCPDLPGLEQYNGCPDTDNDGVMDSKDVCPNVAGLIENKGCPKGSKTKNESRVVYGDDINDTDVIVSEASVPDIETPDVTVPDVIVSNPPVEEVPVSNSVVNKHDQKITQSDKDIINSIAKAVNFESGNTTFSKSTSDQLVAIAQILQNFPNAKWQIEGHTDSIGSFEKNLKLSQERADVVRDYLISKGLKPKNLTAIGYGEKKPIDTNMYMDGRAKNRRVEFKLVK